MAHLDNRNTLHFAHITLMSIGTLILDRVKVPGVDLAIDPIDRDDVKLAGMRAQEITINVLKSGKPLPDTDPLAQTVAQQISYLLNTRHPMEQAAVEQANLVLRITKKQKALDSKQRERQRMAREAVTDRQGLITNMGGPGPNDESE